LQKSSSSIGKENYIVTNSRLDILIYAHDGRGLGHVSRSIGVGMALRRLYPHLKVLFVSGCRQSQELIGQAPLDWLKLPAYETRVEGGKSRGIVGRSMFTDSQLGIFRAKELEQLVTLYRPRLVLADHTPQGKHKELMPALAVSRNAGTKWILGTRGVIGSVSQANSDLATRLYRKFYHGLLWYGDRNVLGISHIEQLQCQYKEFPKECGYVSRLAELAAWTERSREFEMGDTLAGTVSIPWLGEKSLHFLQLLAVALTNIPQNFGNWHLFIDTGSSQSVKKKVFRMFAGLSHCTLEQPGMKYVETLLRSKTAVIYGGYNSLMDVLYTGLPTLVVERQMRDNEQQLHLQRLAKKVKERIIVISEAGVTSEQMTASLLDNFSKDERVPVDVNLDGAAEAAIALNEFLDDR